jgi:hypothetical protein
MAGALYMGARSFKLLAKLLREAQTATNDLPGQLRKMAAFCVIQRVRGDAAFGPLRQLRRAGAFFVATVRPSRPRCRALLCDRFSRYVTGTTVAVYGGLSLYNWIPFRTLG